MVRRQALAKKWLTTLILTDRNMIPANGKNKTEKIILGIDPELT